MPATPSSWYERTVVVVLVAMFLIMVWIGLSLRNHVSVLKTDIQALRALLSSIPTSTQCPPPGTPGTMICHYKLEIQRPLDDHKGWFVATIPKEVVQKAKEDCEKAKAKIPDMA